MKVKLLLMERMEGWRISKGKPFQLWTILSAFSCQQFQVFLVVNNFKPFSDFRDNIVVPSWQNGHQPNVKQKTQDWWTLNMFPLLFESEGGFCLLSKHPKRFVFPAGSKVGQLRLRVNSRKSFVGKESCLKSEPNNCTWFHNWICDVAPVVIF